jgi:hypothetical protein
VPSSLDPPSPQAATTTLMINSQIELAVRMSTSPCTVVFARALRARKR